MPTSPPASLLGQGQLRVRRASVVERERVNSLAFLEGGGLSGAQMRVFDVGAKNARRIRSRSAKPVSLATRSSKAATGQ